MNFIFLVLERSLVDRDQDFGGWSEGIERGGGNFEEMFLVWKDVYIV